MSDFFRISSEGYVNRTYASENFKTLQNESACVLELVNDKSTSYSLTIPKDQESRGNKFEKSVTENARLFMATNDKSEISLASYSRRVVTWGAG